MMYKLSGSLPIIICCRRCSFTNRTSTRQCIRKSSRVYIFSYRVAGILIHNNKILLQRPKDDTGYSIPGGHVCYGETSAQALTREFIEEIQLDINIERLILIGENFWPWGNRPCHQISLYYSISMNDLTQIPLNGTFHALDEIGGERIDLDFCWIPLSNIDDIILYPTNIRPYLSSIPTYPKHFIYHQN